MNILSDLSIKHYYTVLRTCIFYTNISGDHNSVPCSFLIMFFNASYLLAYFTGMPVAAVEILITIINYKP
jgi:hypothetical protein